MLESYCSHNTTEYLKSPFHKVLKTGAKREDFTCPSKMIWPMGSQILSHLAVDFKLGFASRKTKTTAGRPGAACSSFIFIGFYRNVKHLHSNCTKPSPVAAERGTGRIGGWEGSVCELSRPRRNAVFWRDRSKNRYNGGYNKYTLTFVWIFGFTLMHDIWI